MYLKEENDLFVRYKSRGALIDTNLMVLLAVGRYDRRRIETFKNTRAYLPSDYDLIEEIYHYFPVIVATPNVLTEVDNLVRQIPSKEYAAISAILSDLYRATNEIYQAANLAVGHSIYHHVGLADTISMMVASQVYLVITADFELSNRLNSSGFDALNFNHLRTLA